MSQSPDPYAQVLAAWSNAAPHWERHAASLQRMFAPLTSALLRSAAIAPGQRVLDVACGTGDPALAIAAVVGSRGSVVGVDVAEGMVAAARRRAREQELSNATFHCAPADALPLADRSCDRAVCRLGAMFFPDPVAALREMLRVLVPRGRLALAVWGSPQANPFFSAVSAVLDRHVPPVPEPPDAPSASRYAERGKLASLLSAAGAREVEEEVLAFELDAPLSFDAFWTMRTEVSDSLRAKVATLAPERAAVLAGELRGALRPWFATGSLRMPAEARIVAGAR